MSPSRRLRVFYLSFTPPIPTWGGAMAFYRHFVERQDFEIRVATNCKNFPVNSVPYEPVFFDNTRLTRRLFHTRFMPWLYGPHSLNAVGRVPRVVWKTAREFRPDAIFTIAGSWDWSALVAQRVAQRLQVPLIASFNDWFSYGGMLAAPIYHQLIEKRFRRFYRESDLALCTSEGMGEALGPHRNAHILYPLGAVLPTNSAQFQPFQEKTRPFIVAFTGNIGDWYGPMLERLVKAAESRNAPIEFRFYGDNARWSKEFDVYARSAGIFRGHLPFQDLRGAMREVDALILPMGFEERAALVERTSFKTKFLDYLAYQKPILVWGPEYCSAVRVAREFDSAEVSDDPDAERFLRTILLVANDAERQTALVANARRMYQDRFDPEKIHAGLVRTIRATVDTHERTK
jgi:glycosyltransferase involved in cell wall biosynthesis